MLEFSLQIFLGHIATPPPPSSDDVGMGSEIPKDGICLQLDNGFYVETPDGLNFEYYSGDPSGEHFAKDVYSSTPDLSTLERNAERCYRDYQTLQEIFKMRPASKKVKETPSVSKGEEGEKSSSPMFQGKTPGEWVWDDDGITKSRTWVGPDGSEATERITNDGTGARTMECDDTICSFRDERPDDLREEMNSADGWEATDVGGMNFDTKIVYDSARNKMFVLARDEHGNVLVVDTNGITNFLKSVDGHKLSWEVMDSPAWKDLIKRFKL
ncbi:MAG: hypothetical protein BWY40_00356 [bacterium ADurb.Bin270]|nr:hypothetical protein [Myxococcales bacterium]OQA61956.1 MAG: hypothetical protein BWY40_00356 [bacterium ADurb.Bin270]HQH80254.1 hypothetical protein [bacterium]